MSENSREEFERHIRLLQAEIANFFRHVEVDAPVRALYDSSISGMAAQYRQDAAMGKLTWEEAAKHSSSIRNQVMDKMRDTSTYFGRAYAEKRKQSGISFETMIGRKTARTMGYLEEFDGLAASEKATVLGHFKRLKEADKNVIYESIVKAAGKSDPLVTKTMRIVKPAGRTLLFLSLALSVYNVANADDKLVAVGKEASVNLGGIAGGVAGGAAAGLICGPGAPVCVAVGAFVGGAAAAFAVDFVW